MRVVLLYSGKGVEEMNLLEAWESLVWLGAFAVVFAPLYGVYHWFTNRNNRHEREREFDQWMRDYESKRGR